MLCDLSENPSNLIWRKQFILAISTCQTNLTTLTDKKNYQEDRCRIRIVYFVLSCLLISSLADCLCVTQWLWSGGTLQSKHCLLWGNVHFSIIACRKIQSFGLSQISRVVYNRVHVQWGTSCSSFTLQCTSMRCGQRGQTPCRVSGLCIVDHRR